MCCCEKPNINGQPGYCWNTPGGPTSVYPVNPPSLDDGDQLIHDEPGRCGGSDCHSHHFRVVKPVHYAGLSLYVKHGGGQERIRLHGPNDGPRTTGSLATTLANLDSNGRYWLLHAIYSAHSDARRETSEKVHATWRKAASEKRIKTRKYPAQGIIKVWIEDAKTTATV